MEGGLAKSSASSPGSGVVSESIQPTTSASSASFNAYSYFGFLFLIFLEVALWKFDMDE